MQISVLLFFSLTSMTYATFWMGSKSTILFVRTSFHYSTGQLFIIIFYIYLCSESHHNSISQAFTKCNHVLFYSSLCAQNHIITLSVKHSPNAHNMLFSIYFNGMICIKFELVNYLACVCC